MTLTDGELLLGDLQMPKMNFTQSKKFGDQLEKSIALTFIHAQHPDCTIKSPDDTGEFRDQDNLAVPDHMVYQKGKLVAMYESKNKKSIYNTFDSDEEFFSIDEQGKDYQAIAKKHGVSCYAIFYNAERFSDVLFTVDVVQDPGFYRAVDNAWGKHWYGYYLSQCEKHQLKPKHHVNITEDNIKELGTIIKGSRDDMLKFAMNILENCTPARSYRPMSDQKLRHWRNQIPRCKNNLKIYEAIFNLFSVGEGMGLNDTNYKNKISWS